MFKIKIVLIGFSMVVALSTAARAFDLRIGNGGTWVTVPDSRYPGPLGDHSLTSGLMPPGGPGSVDVEFATYNLLASGVSRQCIEQLSKGAPHDDNVQVSDSF